MKELLKYALKLFLFWTILFALQRTVFLVYNFSGHSEISWLDIFRSYLHGLHMDIPTAAYLAAFPLIFTIVSLFTQKKIWIRLSNILSCIFIVLVIIIGLLDLGLYSMWGSKLNAKAFAYALYPSEMMKSFNTVPVWLFTLIFLLELALAYFVYLKWVKVRLPEKSKRVISIVVSFLLIAILPITMRGGLQNYPLNKNCIYFSRHLLVDYAVLNGPWNVLDVLIYAKKSENPYQYFNTKQAGEIVNEMQASSCSSPIQIFDNKRPNIVLILMESVSAENMMKLGGKKPIMPGLDSLTHEALLFNHFYSSGYRTEQGLISYLSGFPAQPVEMIMTEFGKFEKLPNIGKVLADQGYSCNYYYSGNIEFANTKSYLNTAAFTKLLHSNARPWKKITEWGAMDEELFQCHLMEAATDKLPFFSIIMTSTNHEAFNAPVTKIFTENNLVGRYSNTAHYTDSCIFDYIQRMKKDPLYANTIFIITSDHAHFFPLNRQKYEAERHHIPFMILGGPLKPEWKGKTIDHIGSQIDLAATLLGQLDLNSSAFTRSKNILDTCQTGFAFYAFDNGFGMVTPEQTIVFDHGMQQILYKKDSVPSEINTKVMDRGKAYLQVMYDEYLKL